MVVFESSRCDRLYQSPHGRGRAPRRRGAEGYEAGDQGGDLFERQRDRVRRGVPRQPVASGRTRHGFNRHARLTQPGEIALDGAQAHPEPSCEYGTRHRISDCAEKLDKPLLPLHSPKGEVVVT